MSISRLPEQEKTGARLQRLVSLANELAGSILPGKVDILAQEIASCLTAGSKILVAGNGGSAATSSHLVAEFVGRFGTTEQPLPAISLSDSSAVTTALANDFGYDALFERQIHAFGRSGDIFLALSSSGKSQNLIRAAATAHMLGLYVASFAKDDTALASGSDLSIGITSNDVTLIQELSLHFCHSLALQVSSILEASPPKPYIF